LIDKSPEELVQIFAERYDVDFKQLKLLCVYHLQTDKQDSQFKDILGTSLSTLTNNAQRQTNDRLFVTLSPKFLCKYKGNVITISYEMNGEIFTINPAILVDADEKGITIFYANNKISFIEYTNIKTITLF